MTIAQKRPQRFKQGDVSRAVKAAMNAGLKVARVEIEPNGKLSIVAAHGDTQDEAPAAPVQAIDLELARCLGGRP